MWPLKAHSVRWLCCLIQRQGRTALLSALHRYIFNHSCPFHTMLSLSLKILLFQCVLKDVTDKHWPLSHLLNWIFVLRFGRAWDKTVLFLFNVFKEIQAPWHLISLREQTGIGNYPQKYLPLNVI